MVFENGIGGDDMDNLIIAINEYSEEILKKDYIISEEEYIRVKRQLEFLLNHLDKMYDYELNKRNKFGKEEE